MEVTLFSADRQYETKVMLEEGKPEEECPMMMAPIPECKLGFDETLILLPDKPAVNKMVLGCKHAFSALPLLYYFYHKKMQCPMCREGTGEHLHLDCVPTHLKDRFILEDHKSCLIDREEEDAQGYVDMMIMVFEDIQFNFARFMDQHEVYMVIYFYADVEALIPVMSVDYKLSGDTFNDELKFYLSRGDVRDLGRNLAVSAPLNVIQVAVGIRGVARDFVFLDRSPRIDMSKIGRSHVLLGQANGQFYVNVEKQDYGLEDVMMLKDLFWSISMQNFQDWIRHQGMMLFVQM